MCERVCAHNHMRRDVSAVLASHVARVPKSRSWLVVTAVRPKVDQSEKTKKAPALYTPESRWRPCDAQDGPPTCNHRTIKHHAVLHAGPGPLRGAWWRGSPPRTTADGHSMASAMACIGHGRAQACFHAIGIDRPVARARRWSNHRLRISMMHVMDFCHAGLCVDSHRWCAVRCLSPPPVWQCGACAERGPRSAAPADLPSPPASAVGCAPRDARHRQAGTTILQVLIA